MSNYFNPFIAYEKCKDAYRSFIDSYHRFTNPEIEEWVRKNTEEGHLLWREPFLQLSRPFIKGKSLESFVSEDVLEEGCLKIFRSKIDDSNSPPVSLYQHQSEAIINIIQKKGNTIVATGTGSGKSFCFGIPTFEKETLEVCKSDPEKIAQDIPGITMRRALEISAMLKNNEANEELQLQLKKIVAGTRISKRAVSRVIELYGQKAPKKIKENPYQLIDDNYP